MIYESEVRYAETNNKGNVVRTRKFYVFENFETFADVENLLYHYFSDKDDVDVVSIKRSSVREIANKRETNDDVIWVSELKDVFYDEKGEEKELKYKIMFYASTFDHARTFIAQYVKQGYDMTLVSLKLTNFIDVFNAEMLYELK